MEERFEPPVRDYAMDLMDVLAEVDWYLQNNKGRITPISYTQMLKEGINNIVTPTGDYEHGLNLVRRAKIARKKLEEDKGS